MNIQEIKEIIPHRYPMLLIDRVEEMIEGERIVAKKNVTINEPFFQGHFPEEPVMPRGFDRRSDGTSWSSCSIVFRTV